MFQAEPGQIFLMQLLLTRIQPWYSIKFTLARRLVATTRPYLEEHWLINLTSTIISLPSPASVYPGSGMASWSTGPFKLDQLALSTSLSLSVSRVSQGHLRDELVHHVHTIVGSTLTDAPLSFIMSAMKCTH
jgi:hypothetical protein